MLQLTRDFQKVADTIFNGTMPYRWKAAAVILKTISITDLYRAGVLRVACGGWIRIGVNQELVRALQSPKPKKQQPTALPRGVPAPTSESHLGKRSRPEERGKINGKQAKKRKAAQ